jgi:HEPN domain-containing protein
MEEAKRTLVRSWLTKASHDLAAARSLSEPVRAILDIAIYHCQQAAERLNGGTLP